MFPSFRSWRCCMLLVQHEATSENTSSSSSSNYSPSASYFPGLWSQNCTFTLSPNTRLYVLRLMKHCPVGTAMLPRSSRCGHGQLRLQRGRSVQLTVGNPRASCIGLTAAARSTGLEPARQLCRGCFGTCFPRGLEFWSLPHVSGVGDWLETAASLDTRTDLRRICRYGGFTALGVVFAWLFMPEVIGKTLEGCVRVSGRSRHCGLSLILSVSALPAGSTARSKARRSRSRGPRSSLRRS